MRTTEVIMKLNMGFLDGEDERRMTKEEMESNFEELHDHMSKIIPEPDILGLEDEIESVTMKSLEFGEWSLPDYGTWSPLTPPASTTYSMKLTVTIKHNDPLPCQTITAVINAIHDNGATYLFAIEEQENYLLFPFNSEVSDMKNGTCNGH